MKWLDELERLNAERTQGEWSTSGATEDTTLRGPDDEMLATFTAYTRREEDVQAVRALMNAAPRLLRIARAAELYREARVRLRTASANAFASVAYGDGSKAHLAEVSDLRVDLTNAELDLLAALDAGGGGA